MPQGAINLRDPVLLTQNAEKSWRAALNYRTVTGSGCGGWHRGEEQWRFTQAISLYCAELLVLGPVNHGYGRSRILQKQCHQSDLSCVRLQRLRGLQKGRRARGWLSEPANKWLAGPSEELPTGCGGAIVSGRR